MKGGIIGRGRVGSLLARMFQEHGIDLVFFTTRSAGSAANSAIGRDSLSYCSGMPAPQLAQLLQSDLPGDSLFLLFLTTPDDSLATVSSEIAAMRNNWTHFVVYHCCGGIGPEVLDCFVAKGAEGGVLHPCYSVTKEDRAFPRDGTVCFTFSGTAPGAQVAREMVSHSGASFVLLPPIQREAYHAGNVLSSGHIVSLIEAAHSLLRGAGLAQDDAFKILRSLTAGVVNNLFTTSEKTEDIFRQALTGPFVRGDRKLIAQHREALQRVAPTVLPIYDLLGARIEEMTKNRRNK